MIYVLFWYLRSGRSLKVSCFVLGKYLRVNYKVLDCLVTQWYRIIICSPYFIILDNMMDLWPLGWNQSLTLPFDNQYPYIC